MRCVHLNVGKCMFLVITILVNNMHFTQMADNQMHLTTKDHIVKNTTTTTISSPAERLKPDLESSCRSSKDKECYKLGAQCLRCNLNDSCIYGEELSTKCQVNPAVQCKGEKFFTKSLICRYCYQTEVWEHDCDLKANCNSIATTRSPYVTNCTVKDDILCLGLRTFNKNVLCNWTGGYQWSTALILSITLGGFGADRFYLGHWQEGIGKLFSFGGLGVWTLIDVILISLHYLGPADGSLYI